MTKQYSGGVTARANGAARIALHVTPADQQERSQVEELAGAVQEATGGSVELAYVDQGYSGERPADEAEAYGIDGACDFSKYANQRGAKSAKSLLITLLSLLALPRPRNIEALIHHSAHLSIAVARYVGPVLYRGVNRAVSGSILGYGLPGRPLLGTWVNKSSRTLLDDRLEELLEG